MIVRPVVARDRAAWEGLYAAYAEFYDVVQTPEMRARVWDWINDPAHEVEGLVADQGGVLTGFAHVRPFARPLAAATGLYLDDLYVAPTARGTGVAAGLLDAVNKHAMANGHSVVRWITAADNARARGLYDKHAAATQWVTYDMDVGAQSPS